MMKNVLKYENLEIFKLRLEHQKHRQKYYNALDFLQHWWYKKAFRTTLRKPKPKTKEIERSVFFCRSISDKEKSFVIFRTRQSNTTFKPLIKIIMKL